MKRCLADAAALTAANRVKRGGRMATVVSPASGSASFLGARSVPSGRALRRIHQAMRVPGRKHAVSIVELADSVVGDRAIPTIATAALTTDGQLLPPLLRSPNIKTGHHQQTMLPPIVKEVGLCAGWASFSHWSVREKTPPCSAIDGSRSLSISSSG